MEGGEKEKKSKTFNNNVLLGAASNTTVSLYGTTRRSSEVPATPTLW